MIMDNCLRIFFEASPSMHVLEFLRIEPDYKHVCKFMRACMCVCQCVLLVVYAFPEGASNYRSL